MRKLAVLGLGLVLGACSEGPENDTPDVIVAPPPPPTNDNLRLISGYRSADDWCETAGETAFTAEFLDDTADLVACPTGSDAAQSLVASYGARQMAETGGYTIYSVPRR